MSGNLVSRLRGLVPGRPVLVAKVISTSADSSGVELPGGERLTVRGTGTVGGHVFVRGGGSGGHIEGAAPDLTEVVIDV